MLAPPLERQRELLAFVVDPRNGADGGGELTRWGRLQPNSLHLRQVANGIFKNRVARIRRLMPRTCAAIWLELASVIEDFCAAIPPTTIEPHVDAGAFALYLAGRCDALLGVPEHVGDLAKLEAAIACAGTPRSLGNDGTLPVSSIELFEGRFDLGPLFDIARRRDPIERRATYLAIWRESTSGKLRIFAVPAELFSELVRLKTRGADIGSIGREAREFFQTHRVSFWEAGHAG